MQTTYRELEDPKILSFYISKKEGLHPMLRARPLSDISAVYRTVYVQDYLICSKEGWELIESLAKLLGIDYSELDKPIVACKLFSSYLDMKYPTYSYH